mgnify:CR=1 FL=1
MLGEVLMYGWFLIIIYINYNLSIYLSTKILPQIKKITLNKNTLK